MKKKTAMQQIEQSLSLVYSGAISPDVFVENLLAEIDHLKRKERQQICDAWVEGNRRGWAMETDWPKDAEKYFDKLYNQQNTVKQ